RLRLGFGFPLAQNRLGLTAKLRRLVLDFGAQSLQFGVDVVSGEALVLIGSGPLFGGFAIGGLSDAVCVGLGVAADLLVGLIGQGAHRLGVALGVLAKCRGRLSGLESDRRGLLLRALLHLGGGAAGVYEQLRGLLTE